jgi:hypothetical protein
MRLRLPLPEPKFKHMDDMEWRPVLAQDHRGVRRTVREKWLEQEPRCLAFAGDWDPDMVIAQHGHMCTNTIYIVEGSMICGDVECTKGMNITLDIGTPYGPNTTGPNGALVYEVMAGDPSVWYADPEGFAALKQERGIRQLPNPALPNDDGSGGTRATYDDKGMLIARQPGKPKGGYAKPRFKHAEQVEWREVLAQEQNGRRLSAWEKWLDFSPQVMCCETKLDPGLVIPPRGRNGISTVLVLEGSMTVDGRECTRGMHITLGVGVPMGTTVAGRDGVKLYEVRMDDPTAWYVHPDPFDALEIEHGVTPLPAPQMDLPAWMGARRSLYE